mgnify:CR=1 FL=1
MLFEYKRWNSDKTAALIADDIVFRNRDTSKVEAPTIDPTVILAMIGPALVRKTLIECGSSINIIFQTDYDQLRMEAKDLKPSTASIHGFNGVATEAAGYVELPMKLGEGDRRRVRM